MLSTYINQSTNQPVNQSTSQPINQPITTLNGTRIITVKLGTFIK